MLSEVINFVYKSKVRKGLVFLNIFLLDFQESWKKILLQTLVNAMPFLINKGFFTIGNMVFKQDIGIPMGINPAPFWANLFLSFFEFNYIKQIVSNGSSAACKYYGVSRLIMTFVL